MKIVITGSLGHISKPLATALIQKGHAITVISSNPEKRPAIEALGATAAIGALQDTGFIVNTFEGADAVYGMCPPNYALVKDIRGYYTEIGNNYAEAVRKTGVGRVVFLSSMGADLDQGTGVVMGVHDVEGILNALPGVAVTHLRPGYFYYNLYNYIGQIKGAGVISDNFGGDDRLMLVSPADIAAVAAEELERTGTVRPIRYIASDDHSANEVARALGAAIGIPELKWTVCGDAERLEAMLKYGIPPAFAASLVEMGACIHSGDFYRDFYAQKPALQGKVKLEDFAGEFAAAFKQDNVPQHG